MIIRILRYSRSSGRTAPDTRLGYSAVWLATSLHQRAFCRTRHCQMKSEISPGKQIYETISIYCRSFLGARPWDQHASQNSRHLYRIIDRSEGRGEGGAVRQGNLNSTIFLQEAFISLLKILFSPLFPVFSPVVNPSPNVL